MALTILLHAIGLAALLLTLPGTFELLTLTVAGLLPARLQARSARNVIRRMAVVVPAHNEELNVAACVTSLRACEPASVPTDVIVIADNCNDQTALVAEAAGARVLRRSHDVLRGKGYALDFAFQQLLREDYDVLIVVDADSSVTGNFFREIEQAFAAGADATQCRYRVANLDSPRTRLMEIALTAFNIIRPRGRDRMGLSAGIYGNGFALSRATLTKVPYAAASLVEDLEYHLHLVRAGKRVQFLDACTVYGAMPAEGKGVKSQRARWEGGRLFALKQYGPMLAGRVLRSDLRFLEPLLDLLLLPLALHATAVLLMLAAPSVVLRMVALFSLAVLAFHVFAAAISSRRGVRALRDLAIVPFYIGWKLLLIPVLWQHSKSDASWVRTQRAPLPKEIRP